MANIFSEASVVRSWFPAHPKRNVAWVYPGKDKAHIIVYINNDGPNVCFNIICFDLWLVWLCWSSLFRTVRKIWPVSGSLPVPVTKKSNDRWVPRTQKVWGFSQYSTIQNTVQCFVVRKNKKKTENFNFDYGKCAIFEKKLRAILKLLSVQNI